MAHVALGLIPDAWATRRIAREAARQRPRAGAFHALDQDLRYGFRGLTRSWEFSAGVILSLAVGIGGNVIAFSFINGVVFRPFPGVHNQHELVRLSLGAHSQQRFSTVPATYDDFVALREHFSTLAGVSAFRDATFALYAEGRALSARGALVSSNYFDVLGAPPTAGRLFLGESDRPGAAPVAVISEALWREVYGGNHSAIGRSLLVNGTPVEIVGIAPRDFIGTRLTDQKRSIWIPMSMAELTLRDSAGRPATADAAGAMWLDFVGRRKPGVTLDEVTAEATTAADRVPALRSRPRARVSVTRVWMSDPWARGTEIASLMIVPLLVLAIACVNAANLVVARASRSVRDWTIRLAVGATRWRVVRQVLAEAMILSAIGAAIGLALAQWGLALFRTSVPVPMPMDARVALFTIVIAAIAAITFCLGPALHVTSSAATRLAGTAPGAGGSVRSRTRFALVALQAALSLGLLATGAQFTKTVQGAASREHVPSPEDLLVASFNVDPLRFAPQAGEHFYAQLLDRVQRLPGVAAAAVASNGIVIGTAGRDSYARAWTAESPAEGSSHPAFYVSPDFFAAIGIRVKQGRGFNSSDAGSVRSVIVNTPFAEKLLGGQPVGRTFQLAPPQRAPADGVESGMIIISNGVAEFPPYGAAPGRGDALDVTVVGVVDGVMRPDGREPPIVYYPAPLVYQPRRTLYIRVDDTRSFTAASLHGAIRDIDARVPIVDVATLAEIRLRRDIELRLMTRATAALGLLALALAAGGLYSVVSYTVSLRRQEVGVRLALGADARSIVAMIVGQALTPTLIGAAAGAACAAAAGMVIRSRLYGAAPVDPIAFIAATLLMLVVMIAASWVPATQAGRVDPVTVLRQD